MELKVAGAKNKIEVDLIGEDHTFCNLLRENLQKDPDVVYSAYNISHPYVAETKLIVETKGKKKPKDAILNAAEAIGKDNKEFLELFKKAVSK